MESINHKALMWYIILIFVVEQTYVSLPEKYKLCKVSPRFTDLFLSSNSLLAFFL